MTNTRLRLFAHPSGGARAEIDAQDLRAGERLAIARAMFSAVFHGRLRLHIAHAATSVRGRLDHVVAPVHHDALAHHE